jgi:hypothetical protein
MAVIQDHGERDGALRELEYLWGFLQEVERTNPEDGLTKAGIHKMMARIHEELMEYEGRQELGTAQACAKAEEASAISSH